MNIQEAEQFIAECEAWAHMTGIIITKSEKYHVAVKIIHSSKENKDAYDS